MDRQRPICQQDCVSVIIPTHNSEKTLGSCLDSVRRQTYKRHEIIVADNYSTDSTVDLARKMGANVLDESGKPGNVSSSKNFGLMNSTGNYVLFLDSDEVLEARVLAECVELCEKENFRMVKIPLRFVGEGFWSSSSAFWRNCHYNVGKRTIGNFPRFFRREYLSKNMYNENLVWGEDWELYIRMKKAGADASYCKSCMIHLEPFSLKEMILKHISYTKAIPAFSLNVDRGIYRALLRNACLALSEALRKPPSPSYVLAGTLVFLCFKTFAITIGFVRIQFSSVDRQLRSRKSSSPQNLSFNGN
jgi:glycosyltransferase involved in cell wall biosynthesis